MDQGNGEDRQAEHRPLLTVPMGVEPRPTKQFVLTPQVEGIVERALAYIGAGYPVNLAGPAGTGKTTLALHLAAQLGQPVILIHGDDEFGIGTSGGKSLESAEIIAAIEKVFCGAGA